MKSSSGPARRLFASYERELSENPMGFARRVAARYGGFAEIPMQRQGSLFLLSDPDLIREMLIDKRALFIKNTRYDAMRRLLGNGMLLSEHDSWRRQRRLLQPAFKPGALAAHYEWMHDLIAAFPDRWQAAAERGTSVNMMLEFQRLAQSVAGRLTFGASFDGQADALFGALLDVWQAWPERPSLSALLYWRKTRARAARFDRAMAALDEFIFAAAERSRGAGVEGGGLVGFLIMASAAEGLPLHTDGAARPGGHDDRCRL